MAGSIFFGGPHIEDDSAAVLQALPQLFSGHRFQGAAFLQKRMHHAIDLRDSILAKVAQRLPQLKDSWVRKTIPYVQSILCGIHETRTAKHLEMLRSIRSRHLRQAP